MDGWAAGEQETPAVITSVSTTPSAGFDEYLPGTDLVSSLYRVTP
jgi:hypothetical protein